MGALQLHVTRLKIAAPHEQTLRAAICSCGAATTAAPSSPFRARSQTDQLGLVHRRDARRLAFSGYSDQHRPILT